MNLKNIYVKLKKSNTTYFIILFIQNSRKSRNVVTIVSYVWGKGEKFTAKDPKGTFRVWEFFYTYNLK